MSKTRLEAFSDGVIAILITIMVLELKVPDGDTVAALAAGWHTFLAYVLSFILLGIYWNNHHHMLHTVDRVNGRILWANTNLLFWLSLVPFTTAWMGEHNFPEVPTAIYGVVQLLAAIAYTILMYTIIGHQGPDSRLARAVRRDFKGKLSLGLYAAGVSVAFLVPWVSVGLYALVAVIWFIPDRRIESTLAD
jgi:uncharacterized membrane protein